MSLKWDDPVYAVTVAFGLTYAVMIAAATARPALGAGLAGLNLIVAVTAVILMAHMRTSRGVVRFIGVTLPLFVFYMFFKEAGLALSSPQVRWLDDLIARPEIFLWQSGANTAGSPLIGEVMAAAYMSYVPLLVTVTVSLLAMPARGPLAPAETFARRVVIAWGICYLVYLAVPVLGPRFVYPELQAPRLGGGPISALALLNQDHGMLRGAAFPSAHVAATTLAVWSAWQWRRPIFRIALALSLALAIAAVYLAYHYVVDVLAGVAVAGLALGADRGLVGSWRPVAAPPPHSDGTLSEAGIQ